MEVEEYKSPPLLLPPDIPLSSLNVFPPNDPPLVDASPHKSQGAYHPITQGRDEEEDIFELDATAMPLQWREAECKQLGKGGDGGSIHVPMISYGQF